MNRLQRWVRFPLLHSCYLVAAGHRHVGNRYSLTHKHEGDCLLPGIRARRRAARHSPLAGAGSKLVSTAVSYASSQASTYR